MARWSIRIGSVCMPVDRTGEVRSPLVWVATVFVPGGRIGSLGDVGADVGAWMAIEGIEIGTGGGARLGGGGLAWGSSIVSVWVEADATSALKVGVIGVSTIGLTTVGVAGGLKGCSTVWEEVDVISLGGSDGAGLV